MAGTVGTSICDDQHFESLNYLKSGVLKKYWGKKQFFCKIRHIQATKSVRADEVVPNYRRLKLKMLPESLRLLHHDTHSHFSIIWLD